MINLKEIDSELEDNGIIKYFLRKYFFLSNFFKRKIVIDGITYKTNEHYFQSMKVDNEEERCIIINTDSPSTAKKLGRLFSIRKDWEEIKDSVMKKGLIAKFSQHEDLKQRLLNTGNKILREGNWWNDRYWGVDLNGIGKNMLGRLLMEVREELK